MVLIIGQVRFNLCISLLFFDIDEVSEIALLVTALPEQFYRVYLSRVFSEYFPLIFDFRVIKLYFLQKQGICSELICLAALVCV